MMFRLLALGLGAALLTACATTTPPSETASSSELPVAIETPNDASPYGLFLAGRAAINRGDANRAAGYFSRASDEDGEALFLRQRAFTAALVSGDVTRAAVLAPQEREADQDVRQLGLVVRGVDALASGRGQVAYALLTAEDVSPPHRAAAFLLRPWAAAAAGNIDQAIAEPEARGDVIYRYFSKLTQARLLERAGRMPEAEAAFRALIEPGDPDSLASLALGGFLERRGRWQDAVTVYDAAQRRAPTDFVLAASRERAQAHRTRPPMMSIRQGAAEALIGPAEGMMVMRRGDLALAYLRLALRLDPDRADAWILVGDLLSNQGEVGAAREAWGRIPRTSANYFPARSKIAWSYFRDGDHAQAIASARQLAADAPIASGASITLAEMLRSEGQYAEAAEVLTRVIDSPSALRDWRLYYLRAHALQEAGRWPEAERDINAGLALSPQQPELLNFLAYGWIERGEHLEEAMTMIQSAAAVSPQSGAIQDSLGWGYYRQGRFPEAVAALEQAVELEPADPRINDHLGDAYWRAGRRTEAVFQWRRVLSLEPEPRLRAAAEAKIASPQGPDAAPAAPAAAPS
jgi:tetratricopeptide (TPR) repeat protein